jgi:His Kinase A (phospho-acceptor) domain
VRNPPVLPYPEPEMPEWPSSLCAQITHELRSPLNAMTGWLHILQSPRQHDERTLQTAREGLQRAIEQNTDLLQALDDISACQSGRIQPEKSVVDLRNVVIRAWGLAQRRLGARFGATPRWDAPHEAREPVLILTDTARLETLIADALHLLAQMRGETPEPRISIIGQDGVVGLRLIAPSRSHPAAWLSVLDERRALGISGQRTSNTEISLRARRIEAFLGLVSASWEVALDPQPTLRINWPKSITAVEA